MYRRSFEKSTIKKQVPPLHAGDLQMCLCSDQIGIDQIGVGTLDGVIEFDSLLLPQFLNKVVVELLLVGRGFQSIADHLDLVQVKLYIIPAADHRQDSDRFLRV